MQVASFENDFLEVHMWEIVVERVIRRKIKNFDSCKLSWRLLYQPIGTLATSVVRCIGVASLGKFVRLSAVMADYNRKHS